MTDPAIELHSVKKKFGKREVLVDVNLRVEKGEIFAFLGRNGAGKTTTIHILLGLLKREGGEVRVLGLDPDKEALEIRRRVGYMAEDQTMFGWMRIDEILGFLEPFYPTWDQETVNRYIQAFELPLKQQIKSLSKGQNARLALLLALAHKPELVILDDPTLGLDPIMRKELLRDVIDHLQGRGVTVFFSSHLLYEIEPVADKVAILDKGKIVCLEETERLRDSVKRLIISNEDWLKMPALPGILDVRHSGDRVAVVTRDVDAVLGQLHGQGISPQVVDLNLDEIFEAYVIGKQEAGHVAEPVLERVA